MARLIGVLRPRYVLVENVPGLFTRGFDEVLGGLAEGGYHAEWDRLSAAAFGAPHLRDRVFIVAHAERDLIRIKSGWRDGVDRASPAVFAGDGATWALADSDGPGSQGRKRGVMQERPRQLTPRKGGSRPGADGSSGDWWTVESDVGRVAHGVPSRVDRLRGLGNAVVPQVAEWLGRRIMRTDAAPK
jgi:DNA (cytosine-5)-methyltransferase 1